LSDASPVSLLVNDFVGRGVFSALAMPSRHRGIEDYRLLWFRGQQMDLQVDSRHARASLARLLPPIAPRSRFDRRLRAWLRSRQAQELPPHRRVDPGRLQASLRNVGGTMRLTLVSKDGDPLLATRKLLHLVNELYLVFLATPECYDWIVEAFDLDPDRPRWP
jgi:hypothetical protein